MVVGTGSRAAVGISSISGDIFSSESDDEDYNSDDNSRGDVSSESGSGSSDLDSSDSDSDSGVVQCRGTTLAGNRCRITSDHDFAAAEPLQAGSRYCAKHADQEYDDFSFSD